MATRPPPSTSLPSPSNPIVGRSREQHLLRRHLFAALAGRGSLVLLGGEAGIGKTTLVERLAEEARRRGARVLDGHCYDLTLTPPYGPWLDALADLGPAGHQSGLPHPLRPDADRGQIASQSLLFEQVRAFLATGTTRQPVVLVLEDLHWADPASLDLLRHLARGIGSLGLLLIATYRVDELTPQHPLSQLLPTLVRDAQAERIDLPALTDEEVHAFVTSRYALARDDATRLAAHLQSRAGGNPFYLTEVLRSLEAERVLQPIADRWRVGALDRVPVPPLVRQLVEGRLANLDEQTLHLLEIAAVIGQDVPLGLWQAATEDDGDRLALAVDRAIAAHIIREPSAATAIRFTHALVRETLYHRQPLPRRRILHRRVAELLVERPDPPPSIVASHLAEADDPRAVDWLVRAGEQALALYAARDAIAALTRAHELAGRFSQTLPPAAYRARAAAAALLGEFDRARRDHELALERGRAIGDLPAVCRALLDLGMLWAERDYERTIGYYRAALALAREIGDPPTIAYALNRVANWHVNRDEPDVALPLHEEALALFRAADDRAGIADTLDFLGVASYLDSDLRQSARYAEEAIKLFRELDDRQRLSSCLNVLALSGGDLTWIAPPPYREPSYWIRAGDEALAVARQIGWSAGEAFALICLSMVTLSRGDLGRGLRAAETALAISERIGHEQWIIAARQTIGIVWAELLDAGRAVVALEPALAAARVSGSLFWTNTMVASLVSLLTAEGEFDRAAALLGTVALPSATHRSMSQRQCRFAQAELALARGEPELALAIADELAATRPHPAPDDALPQIMKLRGDALARTERDAEAETAYLAARNSARLLHYLPLLRRIEEARGQFLRPRGRPEEAEAAFLGAGAAIDEMAATIDDPALREAFRSRAWARLPLATVTGRSAPPARHLSPRELDVLRHLVEGKSDREIAAALSISPRTVMRHVTRILDKLGVPSRTAAATLAVREDLV